MKATWRTLGPIAAGLACWAASFAILMWMVPNCPRWAAALMMFPIGTVATFVLSEEQDK